MKNAMLCLALVLSAWCAAVPTNAQDSSPAARAALAHSVYDGAVTGLGSRTQASDVYDWSVRWLRAELEAHTANAAAAHLERMSALLARVRSMVGTGLMASSADTECQYYVAEARAWLAHPPAAP